MSKDRKAQVYWGQCLKPKTKILRPYKGEKSAKPVEQRKSEKYSLFVEKKEKQGKGK